MPLPEAFLNSLQDTRGFDIGSFIEVHDSGEQVTSVRLNPLKTPGSSPAFFTGPVNPVPWTQFGYYLAERPSFTFDPYFHAGNYYVQEASSMFLEQAVCQTSDMSRPLRVLDLCAAPGGKSTHIQSLLSKDSLLVSNEVIRSRAGILKDNMVKWGSSNVIVTSNDPADFSRLENYFDLVVVDAPCSGSGLFRRDPEAITEWSENNVLLCSQRQQRIVADVLPALKNEGILIYSTCSYSKQEDEEIATWLTREFNLDYLPLTIDPGWGIVETEGGYRFWPDKIKGEGFFISCFRKKDGIGAFKYRNGKKVLPVSNNEMKLVEGWVNTGEISCIKNNNTIYALPRTVLPDLSVLLSSLKVIYSGTRIGEQVRDKIIPDHALALSPLLSPQISRINLDREQAIRYLQKKDITLAGTKGWQVVAYDDCPLGWINALPNRINNYYPRELRILKDI